MNSLNFLFGLFVVYLVQTVTAVDYSIEKVHFLASGHSHKENVTHGFHLKHTSAKQLPKDEILQRSPSCPSDEGAVIAKRFIDSKRDWSQCPQEDWLVASANADPYSDKVLINIGVNKGYNLAIWLNIFLPFLNITSDTWYKSLMKVTRSPKGPAKCGICGDCGTVFQNISSELYKLELSHQFGSQRSMKHRHVHMIGVDLNCNNVATIQQVLHDLPSLQNSQSFLSIYTACLGLSNVTSTIITPGCPFGDETCKIPKDSPTSGIELPLTTMDFFLERFLHTQFTPPSASTSSGINPYRHYFRNSSTKSYHPLVDILMIDTEGFDYLVIQGSLKLLKARSVRMLVFEYHYLEPWKNFKLEDTKNQLDSYGYDCYFQGQGRLWKITGEGCWHSLYEFYFWSNVMCILREDIWWKVIQSMIVKV
jgi:hypothetical protein